MKKLFYLGFCVTTHRAQRETIDTDNTIYEWGKMNTKSRYIALSRSTNKNILIGWYIKINDEPSYCGEIIGLKKRYLRSTLFIIKLDDDTIKEVSLKRIDGDKIKGDVDFTLIEKIN